MSTQPDLIRIEDLRLETKTQEEVSAKTTAALLDALGADETIREIVASTAVATTPDIDEDYWSYRVRLTKGEHPQAIVGFPKFGTIGVGFALEEDWNTNLPYLTDAKEIADWIWVNRKYEIPREHAVAAIEIIQRQAMKDAGDQIHRWQPNESGSCIFLMPQRPSGICGSWPGEMSPFHRVEWLEV